LSKARGFLPSEKEAIIEIESQKEHKWLLIDGESRGESRGEIGGCRHINPKGAGVQYGRTETVGRARSSE
jgi:hypothetical protein